MEVWLVLLAVIAFVTLTSHYQEQAKTRRLLEQEIEALGPHEFEAYVAELIRRLPGWRAETTRRTGDQGADVIATSPRGVRYAIQVKKYSRRVGNKAVQEVNAAKSFYKTQRAIVVTSGPGYTRAALELAASAGVTLWSADELLALRNAAAGKGASLPKALAA